MESRTIESVAQVYELPGQAVFPESVGIDPASGDAYVGSLADGTLYRLTASGTVETWSAAGADGRRSVAGVKVDGAGRLWAAGGYAGSLYVHELDTGRLLSRLEVDGRPSCVNDIAFDADGVAYVTDSFVPTLFRVAGSPLRLEPWIDLAAAGVPWPDGLNLNGIVLSPDGAHLVTCQTNLGRLWQIELASGHVREVALEGGPLEHCDGMAIVDSTLYVAVNARNRIAVVDLASDGAAGTVRAWIDHDGFAFPTAVGVRADGGLLVVNGQLDRMGRSPALPFTVLALTP